MNLKLCNQKTNTLLKRTVAVLLSVLLLLPICGAASFVGSCNSAGISAEREVKPGSSFVVRLAMDSATTGYEGYFDYDASVLTLTRVVPVNSDLYVDFQVTTETGYVRVTHSKPVRQMLQLTFFVDEDAAIESETTIRFYSGYAISGTAKEKVDDDTFRLKIVERKSSDATLKALNVSVYRTTDDRQEDKNGFFASLVPSFSSSHLVYSLTVANEFAYFHIDAPTNDSTAKITSDLDGELTEGEINTVDVTVRAEDGTEKQYTLQIFRERAPEVSVDVSYIDPIVSSEEPPESSEEQSYPESSADLSEPIESSEEESEESEESQLTSEESSALPESSFVASEENDSSALSESANSSFASSVDSQSSENHDIGKTQNWNGLFFGIVVFCIAAIVVLMIRVLVLVYKKRYKSN